MKQKTITVVVKALTGDAPFQELEFPQVNAALEEGYLIENVHQAVLPPSQGYGWTILTFILEKK